MQMIETPSVHINPSTSFFSPGASPRPGDALGTSAAGAGFLGEAGPQPRDEQKRAH